MFIIATPELYPWIFQEDALDVLPIGRLSRDSADMRKEGGQGIVMRKLVMGEAWQQIYFILY